ncbi:MAG: acyltransferase [Mesorhizobium sp.]|nr:MAG: acyltransferase [Mesorhizobium sp.]
MSKTSRSAIGSKYLSPSQFRPEFQFRPESQFRPEIQGLRAIAVCLVAMFHVWPSLVPGGYVGVDVFFVISGYLITGVLVREGERTGRVDLIAFYARRARRLLPAAMLVLLLVGVLTPLCLPASQWKDSAIEVFFSCFYLENWRLATQAVDYLAAENAPSPVQHYWSLSIEEQFYIVWPALIIAGLSATRVLGMSPRILLRAMFAIITAASIAASIWLTLTNPAWAYFVTHTRIWELGLGGLLALGVPVIGEGVRRFFGFAGIAAILAAAFLFSTKTPFPGYAALLPTLGTVFVILSGQSRSPLSVFSLLKLRPFQFLGDISYSLYLWHWPLVVFFSHGMGEAIDPIGGAAILAASIGLAAISKVHIEDRFRSPQPSQPLRRLAELLASLIVVPIVAFSTVYAGVAQETASVAANPGDYPGAAALLSGAPVPHVAFFAPPLATIKEDTPTSTEDCRLSFDGVAPVSCQFGNRNGDFKVFLMGDSHAEQWVPAFEKVASDRGWNAATYTKSACPLFPAMLLRNGSPYESCLAWGQRMLQIIEQQKPDVVILSHKNDLQLYPEGAANIHPSIDSTLVRLWRDIEALGPKVVVIADTPEWGVKSDECLAKDPACFVPYQSIARTDPLVVAQRSYPHVALIDFKDVVCPDERCPAVIGNVVVWRDRHHLTATYARSMADIFGKRLDAAIASD